MKVLPRSSWTAQYPKASVGTEDIDDTPNFREVEGIQFSLPNESAAFVEFNPYSYLENSRKFDFSQRGYGDISYNLGVASNVPGIFCLRGLCNRNPTSPKYVTVLVLLGNEERPTDLLIDNLRACREFVLSKWPQATKVIGTKLPPIFDDPSSRFVSSQLVNDLPTAYNQEQSVQNFELNEILSYWNYFRGRNDGSYNDLTLQAVRELQADLRTGTFYRKRIDGIYGRYTREAFTNYLRTL